MSETKKSIPLQKFLSSIKQQGYTSTQIYTQGSEVKFLQLCSLLQRKRFLLQVPNRFIIYSTETDHLIEHTDNDYRNFRQREYLEKVKLRDVACVSKYNLCVKNDEVYSCYIIDELSMVADDLEDPDDESPESDAESDIEIDDYPVEGVYPVFNMMSFIKTIEGFESTVLEHHRTITEAEEEMNEKEVERLLDIFDKQKAMLKERMFHIHQEAYNTRRNITKAGVALERTYKLKSRSKGERDRVRFKIDRLVTETEEEIDALNEKLRDQRNQADTLLKQYYKFIQRFDAIE